MSDASRLTAFPRLGGTSQVPPQTRGLRRLGHLVLDAVNRAVPKRDEVVLHSTIDVEDGVLAVLEELHRRGRSATVLLEDPARGERLRALAPPGVRTLPKRSVRAALAFLRARYVMTTESLYGNRPPPPSQVLVNIWHGEPPTKVTARFFAGQGPLRATVAPVCSTLGRAYRAAEFGLDPRRVPVVGAPRNDRMLRASREHVRAALLGDDADRPTLLWLPSFRTARWGDKVRTDVNSAFHAGVPYSREDLDRIDAAVDAVGARLVVKLHPHDALSLTGDFRAVRVLTQEQMYAAGLTVYPALAAFDGLVTDMSSVWVDYLLLDRPLVFAFPDVEDYRDGRGLNLEPFESWVPGPFTRTADELVAALADVVEGRDPCAQLRAVTRRRFHRHRDDRSAERLLDGIGLAAGGR